MCVEVFPALLLLQERLVREVRISWYLVFPSDVPVLLHSLQYGVYSVMHHNLISPRAEPTIARIELWLLMLELVVKALLMMTMMQLAVKMSQAFLEYLARMFQFFRI